MTGFSFSPEVLRTIRARAELGDEDWEIAGRIGCDRNTLWHICSAQRIELKGDRARALTAQVALPDRELRSFAAEAARRGTSPQRLMAYLLLVIAKDGLFLAVLGE